MTSPTRRSTPRLEAAVVVGTSGLLAGIATGRPELVAVTAPLLVLALVGALAGEDLDLAVRWELDASRIVLGDTASVDVEVVGTGRVEVRVETDPTLPDDPSRALRVARRAHLRFDLTPNAWGRMRVGPVHVRATDRFGLFTRSFSVGSPRDLRVLPDPIELRTLVAPRRTSASWGPRPSRGRGAGFEFADIRAWQPGDQMAAVNWRTTARHGELHVTTRHIERGGDVVVLVDTFAEHPSGTSASLHRTVRAALALASAHLELRDRVGIVRFGGYPSWVHLGLGERAWWEIVDNLLIAEASWSDAERSVRTLPGQAFPAHALIVCLTGLADARYVDAVVDLAARGRDLAAVVVSPDQGGQVTPSRHTEPVAALGARLWTLQHRARIDALIAAGIQTTTWAGDEDAASVIARLALSRRANGTTR